MYQYLKHHQSLREKLDSRKFSTCLKPPLDLLVSPWLRSHDNRQNRVRDPVRTALLIGAKSKKLSSLRRATMDSKISTSDRKSDEAGPEWPRLSAIAKLPQKEWMESTMRQMTLNFSGDEGMPFEYAPIEINQIRLLCLKPASSRDSVLEAQIIISNFPNTTLRGWHALSYPWGKADELPGIIVIDGRKMRITANLETALRDVRNEDAIPYWVDAICINQADLVEKGHQIQHMRYIYEKASCVRVWLGNSTGDTEYAMKVLRDNSSEDIVSQLSRNNWSNPMLNGLVSLFGKQYWKRIWIVQELVCGQKVEIHCGKLWVTLDVLVSVRDVLAWSLETSKQAVSSLPSLAAAVELSDPLTIIDTARELRAKSGSTKLSSPERNATLLWSLLFSTCSHQATDPRDKIYALLGLVEDMNWNCDILPVDYSLTVEQVYIDTAKWIILKSENLNLLCFPGSQLPENSQYNFPSWCPNWLDTSRTNDLLSLSKLNLALPTALWRKALVSFGPEQQSMTARGILIDTFEVTTVQFDWELIYWYQYLALKHASQIKVGVMPAEEQSLSLEQCQSFLSLSEPDHKAKMTSPDGESAFRDLQYQKLLLEKAQIRSPKLREDPVTDARLEALWRTLVLDMIGEQNDEMDDLRSMFNCLLGWNDKRIAVDVQDSTAVHDYTHLIRRRISESVHGRQRAFTEERLHWDDPSGSTSR
jgi:hypothetical protein